MHGKNIIATTLSNNNKKTFQAVSPLTNQKLPTVFHEATIEEINQAVTYADKAFPQYRSISKDQRAAFLDAIGDEIQNIGDILLETANQESGLPLDRLTGERGRTITQLKMFANLIREGSWVEASIDTAIPDRTPLPKPDMRKMLVPLGPVVVFGASNFPLAFSTAGGDTASALASGCPVIVKAHPAHPATAELVGMAIINAAKKTDMPEGVFSMVHGLDYKISIDLVTHPKIKAVGFTGSLKGGKALFDAAMNRPEPIPVYAEMGSTNPVFVLPKALKEKGETFAEGLKNSVNMGVGQFCTSPGLVIAEKGEAMTKTVDKLKALFSEAVPSTMLHAGILSAYKSGVDRIEKTVGVEKAQSNIKADPEKTQSVPTVFFTSGSNLIANPHLTEEVFGPVTVVTSCDSKEELRKIAESLHGHLTATVHGTEEDLQEYRWLLSILETKVGRLVVNGFPTGVEICPSLVHGGPFPATTDSRTTSVGSDAIKRFVRPVCYQNFPQSALPVELKDENTAGIWRLVNGEKKK